MRFLNALFATCLFANIALAQAKPFPVYKSHEDYCAANPKMPTCIKLSGPLVLNPSGMTDQQLETVRRLAGHPGTASSAAARAPKMNAVPVDLAGGKADWRFAHPNAAMLMSINLRAFFSSPAMEAALNEITGKLSTQIPGLNPSDLMKARSFINNVDRIYVSTTSMGAGATAQPIVLITGRFDEPFLSTLQLDAATQNKLVNATALLAGDNASLSAATRRLASTAPPGALAQSAEAWASRYDFWMMGNPALLSAAAGATRKPTSGPDFISSVHSFSLGMTFTSDLRVDVVLDTASPQIAEQLARAIRSGQNQRTDLQEYSKNMRVETHGRTVQISAAIDQNQLSYGMKARMQPTIPANRSAPVLTAEPNPNAKPNRVVIYGLEGGPREIKVDGNK